MWTPDEREPIAAAAMELTLLTRGCCHLCDEMHEALKPLAAAAGVAVMLVDVDAVPALEAAYGDHVPVLFVGEPDGGLEICRHRFDRARVEGALARLRAPGD